jgi:hypothetical protein
MSVRWILSLLVLLVGLLTAREFMARSNDRPVALQPESAKDKPITVTEMTVREPRPPAVAMTECEQIWDPATHMTREEWAQACRRVEGESPTGR